MLVEALRASVATIGFDGKEMTIPQLADVAGVSPATIRGRLARGMTAEQAVSEPVRGGVRTARMLTHNGDTASVPEWSRRLGISVQTIFDRLEDGRPIDQVLAPANKTELRLLTHNGVTMNAAEWARALNIPEGTVWTRLRKGWPTERVLAPVTRPTGGRSRARKGDARPRAARVPAARRMFRGRMITASEMSRAHGVDASTVKKWFSKGADLDEVFRLHVPRKYRVTIMHRGVLRELREIASLASVPLYCVREWVRLGEDVDEKAAKYRPRKKAKP